MLPPETDPRNPVVGQVWALKKRQSLRIRIIEVHRPTKGLAGYVTYDVIDSDRLRTGTILTSRLLSGAAGYVLVKRALK